MSHAAAMHATLADGDTDNNTYPLHHEVHLHPAGLEYSSDSGGDGPSHPDDLSPHVHAWRECLAASTHDDGGNTPSFPSAALHADLSAAVLALLLSGKRATTATPNVDDIAILLAPTITFALCLFIFCS